MEGMVVENTDRVLEVNASVTRAMGGRCVGIPLIRAINWNVDNTAVVQVAAARVSMGTKGQTAIN